MSSSSIRAIRSPPGGSLGRLGAAAAEHLRGERVAGAVAAVLADFADDHVTPLGQPLGLDLGLGAVAPADAHAHGPDEVAVLHPDGAAVGRLLRGLRLAAGL